MLRQMATMPRESSSGPTDLWDRMAVTLPAALRVVTLLLAILRGYGSGSHRLRAGVCFDRTRLTPLAKVHHGADVCERVDELPLFFAIKREFWYLWL